MPREQKKRLDPELRKAEILLAARRLLSRSGLGKFSAEAVAREAGIAGSLTRHYYGGHNELLIAAVRDAFKDFQTTILDPDLSVPLSSRLSGALDFLAKEPWAYSVYLRGEDMHPTLREATRKLRRMLAEFSFLRPWAEMSQEEQLHARGWVGYVEALIAEWLAGKVNSRDAVLNVMLKAAEGMGVRGVTSSSVQTSRRVKSASKPLSVRR